MLMLPSFSHPNSPRPPHVLIFPWRTDCDSQHSIMVRRGAAFKAQIDVSDIIVSLHKTVGRGSRGRSLAGGFGSKLTVVCNIKHFPDPQTGVNLSAITVRHVALKRPTQRALGCKRNPTCASSSKVKFYFWNRWGRWYIFPSPRVRKLLNTCSLFHKQANLGVDAHMYKYNVNIDFFYRYPISPNS